MDFTYLKLEIFLPEENLPELQAALREVDAGHIGNYDSCLSYTRVRGMWRPLAGSEPYIGKPNEISCEPEIKVEVTILADRLRETILAVKCAHPYEEPVINVIPLLATGMDDFGE